MLRKSERGLWFVLQDFNCTYVDSLDMSKSNTCTMALWRLKRIALFICRCYNKLESEYLKNMYSFYEKAHTTWGTHIDLYIYIDYKYYYGNAMFLNVIHTMPFEEMNICFNLLFLHVLDKAFI